MRKEMTWILLTICLLCVTGVHAKQLPGEVLLNPGFESGVENWMFSGQGITSSVTDSVAGFLGLQLQRSGSGILRLEQALPDGTLKPGDSLTLQAWLKPNTGCDAQIELGISCAGGVDKNSDVLIDPSGWMLLSVETVVRADANSAVIYFEADGASVDFVIDEFVAYTWPDVWWHSLFSVNFDGHGNYTAPHLDTLNPTVSSLSANGYNGLWDIDLERDEIWSHYSDFEARPNIERLVYIEGANSDSDLCRSNSSKNITLQGSLFWQLNSANPGTKQWAENNFYFSDGYTLWFGDWEFMTQPQDFGFTTRAGNPLPTPTELGLNPFTHPLDGSSIDTKDEYWQTRSGRPLFEAPLDPGQSYAKWEAYTNPDVYTHLEPYTQKLPNNELLIIEGERMLLDDQYARYHAATAYRAMDVLDAGMIHYDDYNLTGPTYNNADADIYVAAFREFVQNNWTEQQCNEFGFTLATVDQFDVINYLKNPPWINEYSQNAEWWAAADTRWLSNRVWRSFQIGGLQENRNAMELIYQLNKQNAPTVTGRDIPFVANIIPSLGSSMNQYDLVDMPNFEWPMQNNYSQFPTPLGYYPQSRPGIGSRMMAKISVTGHTMVNPYVEPQYCGWDGNGYTSRNYETLHKILYFDLIANRGVPNFALTFNGMYSPGSIYSAAELHTFINGNAGEILSKRKYIADIGVAASGWSHIAPQPIFQGWESTHTLPRDRYMSELIGWSEFLARSTDFPQWDYVAFDDATLDDLAPFKLVILPSVLAVTSNNVTVLDEYLALGGRLLITGETGAFDGPDAFLMPHTEDVIAPLETAYPTQIVRTTNKPGFDYQTNPGSTEQQALQNLLDSASAHTPALTTVGVPQHIGIFLNKSLSNPDEIAVDMVNYNYTLSNDTISAISSSFDVQLDLNQLSNGDNVTVKAINYDEAAADNQTVQTLDASSISWSGDTLIIQVPAFEYYQVLQILFPMGGDTTPPTPDPATWASAPAAVSDTEITMTATTGSDASGPVEYFFDETSGNPGGTDSGWQTSPTYNDTGLSPSTQYTYTVQMRDSASIPNVGGVSAPANATTTGGCSPTDMHIESVVCSEVRCGGPNKNGRTTVTIHDDCGNAVANALVTVTFSGDISETVYDVPTNASGQAVLTSSSCVKMPAFNVTVDSVTHGTLPHDSNDDLATGCSG